MSDSLASNPGFFTSHKYQDIYFNQENPEGEKDFVFIQGNNLPVRLSAQPKNFVVAELGFGFGLNCALTLATLRETDFSGNLHYYSVEENFPAKEAALALLPRLNRARETYTALWQQSESLRTGRTIRLFGAHVKVFPGQVQDFLAQENFLADVWFFDGFSPAKNPAMWSDTVFKAAFDRTRSPGSFATYSSAGWVKRNLLAAGFTVSKVAGFAGKREMLTGYKA